MNQEPTQFGYNWPGRNDLVDIAAVHNETWSQTVINTVRQPLQCFRPPLTIHFGAGGQNLLVLPKQVLIKPSGVQYQLLGELDGQQQVRQLGTREQRPSYKLIYPKADI